MANFQETSESLSQQRSLPDRTFMVPLERNKDYVRRGHTLSDIGITWAKQRRVILTGSVGVGKSQIALEYCYRVKEVNEFERVFWTSATSIPHLQQGYKAIADTLRIPEWDNVNVDSLDVVKKWLSNPSNGSWLLILDGADDEAMFFPPVGKTSIYDTPRHDMAEWLPQNPHGSIIITTRDCRLGKRFVNEGKLLSIKPMDQNEAARLLRSKVSDEDSEDFKDIDHGSMRKLFEVLGHNPLAIRQAAAFIKKNATTLPDYTSAIVHKENESQKMLDQDLQEHPHNVEGVSPILSTWKLSFHQISMQNPLAARILSMMAFLDVNSVPECLLTPSSTDPTDALFALQVLMKYSLITVLNAGKVYQMHRPVQCAVRQWLKMYGCTTDYQREALQSLAKNFPVGDFKTWEICEELLPHAHLVLEYEMSDCQSQRERATLLTKVGYFDSCQGRYELAERRLTMAFKIRQHTLGKRNEATIQTASYLGQVLFRATKYVEGEKVMRYVVDVSTAIHGKSRSVTRMNMGHLAEMLTGQGRFDESEALFRQALKLPEESDGWFCRDRTDTINADNLGAVLRRKGQYEKAEIWIHKAMQGQEMDLGKNHLDTLRVINHLALVHRHMGDFEEAERLHRKALTGFEQTIGREHHFTLQSLDNLSAVLRCQGKLETAEQQSRRAFEGLRRLLGDDYRHTLQAEMSLALALKEQGQLRKAADLARDVIKKERRSLGDGHPQIEISEKVLDEILGAKKEVMTVSMK